MIKLIVENQGKNNLFFFKLWAYRFHPHYQQILSCVSFPREMEDEVVLLDYWPSPFGARVRIALAEKGISYTHKFENLANKSPLLNEMNPVHQKIPVLIHGGKPICESHIIIEYIDEVWKGNSPLLPTDHYHKAKARFLVDFINSKVKSFNIIFPKL